MRACPKCGGAMEAAKSITIGGLENKEIAWHCRRDQVTAELRHPVQYVHIHVGEVEEVDGHRRRLVHKEIRGAELVVYHEPVTDAPPGTRPREAARPARASTRRPPRGTGRNRRRARRG
jgi:hypothetical protein